MIVEPSSPSDDGASGRLHNLAEGEDSIRGIRDHLDVRVAVNVGNPTDVVGALLRPGCLLGDPANRNGHRMQSLPESVGGSIANDVVLDAFPVNPLGYTSSKLQALKPGRA